jgi:hypothetical protein
MPAHGAPDPFSLISSSERRPTGALRGLRGNHCERNMSGAHRYGLIPALRFRWLTPAYDLVVRLTTRESPFKAVLVAQLVLPREGRVLDLGCAQLRSRY